jgi:hypothetical protein
MRTTPILAPIFALAFITTAASAQSGSAPSATSATARPAPAALPADSFDLARKYTKWFYEQQVDSLVAHHPAEARKDPALATQLLNSYRGLTEHAGKELWVTDERFITRNGQRQYWRTATFTAFDEPVLVRWVMNSKGEITGLGLGPKSDAPPIDPAP